MTTLLLSLAAIHATLCVLIVLAGMTNPKTNLTLIITWAALSMATAITLAKVASWAS